MDYDFLYESLTSQFMDSLLLSNKRSEVINKIGPKYTTEEMFSYFWNLREAQRSLIPDLLPPRKSKYDSCMHCKLGDSFYQVCDLAQALNCYNLAILSAPHPTIDRDNAKKHGKNMYKELAQAYEFRSLVLFDLKQYKKCSDDIDRALKLDCAQSSKQLIDRKCTCLKLISMGKDKPFDASAEALQSFEPSFAYINPEPPKIAEPNPTMPSFSSAAKLAYTDSQGRHMIAEKDINPGEIVCIDDGYCSIIEPVMLNRYCNVCVKRCMAPLPCPNCSMVIFCSEECRTLGLSSTHWHECPVLPTLCKLNQGFITIAYKLMMKTSHAKFKEIIPLLKCEVKAQPLKNLGFNPNGIYDATDYRSVYHLKTNREKLSSEDLLHVCAEAFIATKLLQLSGRYFLDSDGEPFTPNLDDILLTGSTLTHLMMIFRSSSPCFGTTIFKVSGITSDNGHLKMCGSGAYTAISLFNHSCNPNCFVFGYGKSNVVRAIQFIPVGKSLTIKYNQSFDEAGKDVRRLQLQDYYFTCTCEACENDWPSTVDFELLFLNCTKCNEPGGINLNPITQVCLKCQLNYDQRNVQGSVMPHKFRNIYRKIEKSWKDYKIAKENILQKGSNSEKDIKVVRNLIKLLCKYAEQPSYLLLNAQYTLIVACFRRGSCVYIKNDIEMPCSIS